MQFFYKLLTFIFSIIIAFVISIFIAVFIAIAMETPDGYIDWLAFPIFPLLIFLVYKYLKSKWLIEPEKPNLQESQKKRTTPQDVQQKVLPDPEVVSAPEKRRSFKFTVKGRALETIQWELEDLMHNDIELVASAYRSTVSSNSFGKKNYTKFKKELLEYLVDNTSSKDVRNYAENMGDFGIPDQTIYQIEDLIDDYSLIQNYDDEMDPYEYEHFCAKEFLKNDWDEAYATSGSADQGIDVIAKRGEDHLAGQCKKYQKPVGNSAVQEVVAGMAYYKANLGVVISNAGFTNSAKKLAEVNNIKLIHHSEIKNL